MVLLVLLIRQRWLQMSSRKGGGNLVMVSVVLMEQQWEDGLFLFENPEEVEPLLGLLHVWVLRAPSMQHHAWIRFGAFLLS